MKALYTNDRFFLISTAVGIAGLLGDFVLRLLSGEGMGSPTAALFLTAVCELCLYISYKNHGKNVMKGMMGALLMALVLGGFDFTRSENMLDNVFAFANIILLLSLAANHFLINSSRFANPENVSFNQALSVIYVLTSIAWNLNGIILSESAGAVLIAVSDIVAKAALICVIVCVESRLDAYRTDREAGGWTAEKGYPEEYDREKNYGTRP